MDKTKIRMLRLKKEEMGLEKQPMDNAFVQRQEDLKFYYCLYNLEDDFKDGFYFGLLELHNDYPFAAPKLFMYTPNGRYEVNMAICTSFTNYHQESWTSAWNATISFMHSNEPSYGCKSDPSDMRKKNARDSLSWNMENDTFKRLFAETIKEKLPEFVKKGIHIYDKTMIANLQKLGLEQINKQNQVHHEKLNHQKPYHHKLQDALIEPIELRQPLINNNNQPEDKQILDNQGLLIDLDQQAKLKQALRKRQQRRRMILKTIGYVAGFVGIGFGIGFIVYYFGIKSNGTSSPDGDSQTKGVFQSLVYVKDAVGRSVGDWFGNLTEKVKVKAD